MILKNFNVVTLAFFTFSKHLTPFISTLFQQKLLKYLKCKVLSCLIHVNSLHFGYFPLKTSKSFPGSRSLYFNFISDNGTLN